jgi:ATP-dependent Clp protease ATP-binding subunit ClpB
VRIKDSAMVAAAVLSQRYISDRFLPDKGIDLMDEAAAKLRTEIDSMPAELDEILRRQMQLEIEREALKKESDRPSRERLGKNREAIGEMKTRIDCAESSVAGGSGSRQKATRHPRTDRASEARDRSRPSVAYDLNKAAELKLRKLPGSKNSLNPRSARHLT